MSQILVCVLGISFLIWLFKRDFFIWWYTPYCIPCQKYTKYTPEHKESYDWFDEDDQYVVPEQYHCTNCGRICSMEDAFRWKY